MKTLLCLSLLAISLGLPCDVNAQDRESPRGMLDSPRLSGLNIDQVPEAPSPSRTRESLTQSNIGQEFTFEGWIDFAPGQGEIWIYVGCDGDSYVGNGQLRVKVGAPSDETEIVDGRTVWRFSIGPFKPFHEAIDEGASSGMWCGKPWQDGGTARLSVYAYRYSDGASEQLTYLDDDGVPVESHDLILADHNETPVTQGQFIGARYTDPLYPEPDFLGKKHQNGLQIDTQLYYKSVSVDSVRNGYTSKDATIWKALPKLKDFKRRYFTSIASCRSDKNIMVDVAPGIYFNKGDLALGREMHCAYNDCTKETACYVKNFSCHNDNIDGVHAFGCFNTEQAKTYAKASIDANRPFATVAMVSRGALPDNAPNKVFFAVYDHDAVYRKISNPLVAQEESPLGLVARLDDKASNLFIPGNCLACHGAQAQYLSNTRQVYGAQFLPFDLQHGIEFFSDDPRNGLSRAAQESIFKQLNRAVATTDIYKQQDARVLLNGFYGASFETGSDDWPQPTFQNDFMPDAWDVNNDTRQLYRTVVAPYCRTCHIGHPSLHFGTWDNFVLLQFRTRAAVCKQRNENIMPNAEATMNRFWRSAARAQFVSRMNGPGCGLQPYE